MAIANAASNLIRKAVNRVGNALVRFGSAGKAATKAVSETASKTAAATGVAQKAARKAAKSASKSKLAPLAKDTVEIAGKTAEKKAKALLQKERASILKGLGIKRATIRRLIRLEPTAFVQESLSEIGKAMHIPQELMPQLAFVDSLGKGADACYELASHGILISHSALKKPKFFLFSEIAHEMQHAKQGLRIFRSKIAPEVIRTQSRNAGEILTTQQINAVRSMTPQQLEQLASDNPLRIISNILQSNDSAQINAFLQSMEKAFKERQEKGLLAFRKRLLKILGPLSSEAEEIVAKEYYNGFNKSISDRLKGNMIGYAYSLPEREAYLCGGVEFWSFLLKSLI